MTIHNYLSKLIFRVSDLYILLIFVLLIGNLFDYQAASIVKCTTANGKIIYQDKPCRDSSKQTPVKLKADQKTTSRNNINRSGELQLDLTTEESFDKSMEKMMEKMSAQKRLEFSFGVGMMSMSKGLKSTGSMEEKNAAIKTLLHGKTADEVFELIKTLN